MAARLPLAIQLAVALLCLASVAAEVLHGRVIGVADGDTVTVLDANKEQLKIRFAGIDAPERKQPFGIRSRQNLARYVARKDVRLDCPKVDRYGRKVCKVWVQPLDCTRCGKTLDVGLAQITDGMAWWFRRYADEQSAEDRGRYESAEQDARLRKRGLWRDNDPVPPWEFRRRGGK